MAAGDIPQFLREGTNISTPSTDQKVLLCVVRDTGGGTLEALAIQAGGKNTIDTVPVGPIAVGGPDEHDEIITSNPVLLGAFAKDTEPIAVSTDGDIVRLWADKTGQLRVKLPSVSTATNDGKDIDNTASGTTVLAANPLRKFATIVNDSDVIMYLHLSTTGGSVVINKGIRLNPNGGAYEINANNLYTGAIAAINASASVKRLTVVEG